jgi:hypothetical protein
MTACFAQDFNNVMSLKAKILNESPNDHCKIYNPSANTSNDKGLVVQIKCSIQCESTKTTKDLTIEKTFIPELENLKPGNGSDGKNIYWGSLGITLKGWSEEQCLIQATKECQQIENVKSMKSVSISSGKWSMTNWPQCESKERIISPFWEKSGAIMANETAELLLKSQPSQIFEFQLESDKKSNILNLQNCKNIIDVNLCYGDCVDLNPSQFAETLATSEPLGKSSIKICADEVYEKLNATQLKPEIKKSICERKLWSKLISFPESGSSCAALRGNLSCQF